MTVMFEVICEISAVGVAARRRPAGCSPLSWARSVTGLDIGSFRIDLGLK
jgi:hypothetical protein